MPGKIVIPSNLEDPTVLRRFITDLVNNLNSNELVTGSNDTYIRANTSDDGSTLTTSFINALVKNNDFQSSIKQLIGSNLQEQVLSTQQKVAKVSSQFGTFYSQAQAAAWYGLTVKAGGTISGYATGSIDTDTTTPGTEGSFFTIGADSVSFVKAIEDVTDPAELAYLEANNLPYGSMYDADTESIIPSFLIEWNGIGYNLYFNGSVSFNNVTTNGESLNDIIDGNGTTKINGGAIETNTITASQIATSSITADKLNVSSLSAVNANLGTVVAGKIERADGKVVLDITNGIFRITV